MTTKTPRSSNGRTRDSESRYLGSNPSLGTKQDGACSTLRFLYLKSIILAKFSIFMLDKQLGLAVDTKHGKGSHILIKHPKTDHKYTIQNNLHKFINMKIFKKMLEWGFDEEQI